MFWWNVPPAMVLLTSNLPKVLMAVYERRAVSQGILFICVPPRCFTFSLTLCRSRITTVNDFAYINVLTIYYAPLCVVMLQNIFLFSVFRRTRISLMRFCACFFLFLSILWHSQTFGITRHWRTRQTLNF